MKTIFLSISVAFLSLSGAFSADPHKIEVASQAEGVFVTYSFFVTGDSTVIELKGGKFRYWHSGRRNAAELEGLEGTYTAEGDKIVLKHPKLMPPESNWMFRTVDGVGTLWRSDVIKQLEAGEMWNLYHSGKESFFRIGEGSILVPSKKTAEEAWKWSKTTDVIAVAAFLEGKDQKAEQDGTGQPATRPESKSEGGDKPQPESEPRPR
jgi:hypothetical protein